MGKTLAHWSEIDIHHTLKSCGSSGYTHVVFNFENRPDGLLGHHCSGSNKNKFQGWGGERCGQVHPDVVFLLLIHVSWSCGGPGPVMSTTLASVCFFSQLPVQEPSEGPLDNAKWRQVRSTLQPLKEICFGSCFGFQPECQDQTPLTYYVRLLCWTFYVSAYTNRKLGKPGTLLILLDTFENVP